MIRFFAALAALCLTNICAGSLGSLPRETLINGQPVYPGEFQEVLYIRGEKGRCSATAIGKYVVLTAAHCVEHPGGIASVDLQGSKEDDVSHIDGVPKKISLASDHLRNFVVSAKCSQHPYYRSGHLDYDIAICKTSTLLPGPYASISKRGPDIGENILLVGYGCTQKDGTGGNNGILSFGVSTVRSFVDKTVWFQTGGRGTLCFGDSGGPSFHLDEDNKDGHRYVLGINSRGDIDSVSFFTSVFNKGIRQWMKFWQFRHHSKICGLEAKCDVPSRETGAHVRFESMVEST